MKNRTLGGLLIISGTAIGAGMLAMPLTCARAGFLATALLLIALWLLTTYSALLLVEAYQQQPSHTGLSTLVHQYLGHYGYWITHTTLLLLLYSLIVAYIAAGGSQLATKLTHCHWLGWHWAITPQQGILLLTAITATVVCSGTAIVDISNRLLFSIKIITLILLLILIGPQVQSANLLTSAANDPGAILPAIPVVFTAFGFHGTLPSMVHYLGGDTKRLRYVVIGGGAIPLLVYLSWQWAIQGILDQQQFLDILANHPGVEGLMQAIYQKGGSPWLGWAVDLFANLALTTSLLGVSLGLTDYWRTLAQLPITLKGRLKAGTITFLPPMAFALLYPHGFIIALGYAAIALAILALLLPALLVCQIRRQHKLTSSYQVGGSSLTPVVVIICGLLIIITQLAVNFGWWR